MADVQCTNTSSIAVWVGSVATLLAVIVALFKEEFVRMWRRPVLEARILLAPPDCQRMPTTFLIGPERDNVDSYFLRLWIENTGRQRAENVQVFAAKLLRRHADGTFKEDKAFFPMNLRWANQQNPLVAEIFTEGISPGMGKHCDLAKILDPSKGKKYGIDLSSVKHNETILELSLEVSPNTKSNLLAPGVYRLELRLAAANVKPVTKTIEINHTGVWHEDETKMFSDGIGMREI